MSHEHCGMALSPKQVPWPLQSSSHLGISQPSPLLFTNDNSLIFDIIGKLYIQINISVKQVLFKGVPYFKYKSKPSFIQLVLFSEYSRTKQLFHKVTVDEAAWRTYYCFLSKTTWHIM